MTGLRIAALSVAAASAFAFSVGATSAHAAGATYRSQSEACLQNIKDAEEARRINPVIGDKATVVFEQLIADALKLCEAQKFAEADKLVNSAKGMVASE